MKYRNIKHTLWGIAAIWATSLSTASCVGDDNTIETSPECVVTSFGVGKITTDVIEYEYDKEGNAKPVVKTKSILGSDIHFNIDQVNGHIYTTDSLPQWVDLSKVNVSFTCYGSLYYKLPKEDDLYFRLTSGTDSIDASQTANLLCVATDGVARKAYKVDIYKRKTAIDTLEWKASETDLRFVGEPRLYHSEGKVVAFLKDSNGRNMCAYSDDTDGATWSSPITIPVESNSVILQGSTFYGTNADGFIFSTSDENFSSWKKMSDRKVDRLLAADVNNIYALDGSTIIGSADMNTWSAQSSTVDTEMLPDSYCNYAYYTSKTNDNICTVVMTGLSSHNNSNGVAWYKQTSAQSGNDMPWAYIEVTPDNKFGLPRMSSMSMTRYEGALYVMGAENGSYNRMYRSDDNGISWHQLDAKYPLPADLTPQNGAAGMIAVGSQLWIIQENGKIWRGSIL